MGSQVYFYMSLHDEEGFGLNLREANDAVIIPSCFHSSMPIFRLFRELDESVFDDEGCHVWNRSISPNPIITEFRDKGFACIDFLNSEVINMHRCRLRDGTLSVGRLHVEKSALVGNDSMASKGEDFLIWSSTVMQWIRRSYKKLDRLTYIGPDAQKLLNAGTIRISHIGKKRGMTEYP